MRTVYFDTWSDYIKRVETLFQQSTEQMGYPNWYRGQPEANWQLQTTLERSTGVNLEVSTYCQMIEDLQPVLETFANKKWELSSSEEFISSLKDIRVYGKNTPIHFHYMGYLRHYGFPSPLLDWTHSPFVAAYFAFRDITSSASSVAIYEYMETSEQHSIADTDQSQMYSVHVQSRNNPRYYLQQGVFTVCLKNIDGKVYFSSHEDPNLASEESGSLITKCVLPASERVNALYSLDTKNINAYSLFGSEESLLETLFLRKYIKAQIWIKYQPTLNKGDMWKLGP